MEIAGYIAAALIGVSLGLIGGGGSILTVPVMVYLFGIQPLLATSYSLFIVGSTSLVGAISNWKRGLVSFRTAFLFGMTSVITVFITRKFLVPAIPGHIATIYGFALTSSRLTMLVFALLMLVASLSMIKKKKLEQVSTPPSGKKTVLLLLYGVSIGLVTGFLGAGGGFLLIPALVLLVGLPMKKAIGTSLMIIAFNSIIGFTGDLGQMDMDWWLLLKVSFIAIVGIVIGGLMGKKISGNQLKRGFGWFVLVMGIYIMVRETLVR